MTSLPDFRNGQVVVHVSGGSGERLRFRNDNLVVEDKGGKILLQRPCRRIFALLAIGETSVTSVLAEKSGKFGFPIILLGRNMRPLGSFRNQADGNVLLRKAQYGISPERSLGIAKRLVGTKIRNQAALLGSARYVPESSREAISALRSLDVEGAPDPDALRGIEGTASRIFFGEHFRNLGWVRREPRKRPDPCNLLLDIGYSYLFNFVSALLSLYGFDLYCGVFHTFFHRRMSLVCDIVEPFRCVVDRRVRKMHTLGQISKGDFFRNGDRTELSRNACGKYARLFLGDILARKDDMFLFCRDYYRWFVRERPFSEFPGFSAEAGRCTW